ncbi:putative HAD-superfamily hydrolase (subfamily IA protein) [Desulforapulum autotrophicum HRM2]|uniref:phosphoglycolate phosphatase n=1 Tax=Desulforapulum autotrophicum (strain ATCC 43914 / DSM 3382 / VKM B-1955 / HRM2) TaxID=177437 RepID=C0QKW2_DESAH|nr:putative HAD-superfamily hydrolase (subfamily IA protein) [Desulforapulum autotrophicum HRM2]
MLTNKIKAVVFDCDGVMFDTADVNRRYYNQLLAGFNKPPLTEPQFVKVHMFSVKDAIAYLFPEREDLTDVFAHMKGLAYGEFISHMVIEPGLKDFLDSLKERMFIRAVATNRTNTMAEVLKTFDLEHRFESVVTAADVKNPKPAPDQLLKIMDHFKLAPREILFIGDSAFDQMAADKAGTVFVAFNNPSLKADFYFNSMADIKAMLNINQ